MRSRDGWVQSKNATAVLYRPPNWTLRYFTSWAPLLELVSQVDGQLLNWFYWVWNWFLVTETDVNSSQCQVPLSTGYHLGPNHASMYRPFRKVQKWWSSTGPVGHGVQILVPVKLKTSEISLSFAFKIDVFSTKSVKRCNTLGLHS